MSRNPLIVATQRDDLELGDRSTSDQPFLPPGLEIHNRMHNHRPPSPSLESPSTRPALEYMMSSDFLISRIPSVLPKDDAHRDAPDLSTKRHHLRRAYSCSSLELVQSGMLPRSDSTCADEGTGAILTDGEGMKDTVTVLQPRVRLVRFGEPVHVRSPSSASSIRVDVKPTLDGTSHHIMGSGRPRFRPRIQRKDPHLICKRKRLVWASLFFVALLLFIVCCGIVVYIVLKRVPAES